MADVLSQHELDNYREQADRFIAAIDEEYYLHYAGLKDTLDLEPIYEQFVELTEPRAGKPDGRGRERRPPHPRALALRVPGLPREPDARARGEDGARSRPT